MTLGGRVEVLVKINNDKKIKDGGCKNVETYGWKDGFIDRKLFFPPQVHHPPFLHLPSLRPVVHLRLIDQQNSTFKFEECFWVHMRSQIEHFPNLLELMRPLGWTDPP